MQETPKVAAENTEIDELDKLEVVEADELQEGVAFHAFQFATISQ